MAIIFKTLKNNKKYAYMVSRRSGGKIVQAYLGPMGDENVNRLLALEKESSEIPKNLYWLFWDTDPQQLNLQAYSKYIIERILELGNGQAFRWLQIVYPTKKIIEVLWTSQIVSQKSKIFWKIWFGMQ